MQNGQTFAERFGPRGVIHSFADGRIEDTGPLTRKRMETVDDDTVNRALEFIRNAEATDTPWFVWWNGTRMHFRTHVNEEMRGISGQDEYADAGIRVAGTGPADQQDIFGLVDERAVVLEPDHGLVGGTVGELEAGQVAMCRSKMAH